MKAKHFKKLRSQVKYYQVESSFGLFGRFDFKFEKGGVVLAKDFGQAVRRAYRRGVGREFGYPTEPTTEMWGKFRVKELGKSDHWRNIKYFK